MESNSPIISVKDEIYWNLKNQIKITIEDESIIDSYDVSLSYDGKKIPINVINSSKDGRRLDLLVYYKAATDKATAVLDGKKASLVVTAKDSSKLNFFSGNVSSKKSIINLDVKKPQINIISQSTSIAKGGSALVIFQTEDENMKETYISSSYNKKFKTIKFL